MKEVEITMEAAHQIIESEENLDDLMNKLTDMREVIASTEEGLKELKQRKTDLEAKLIAKMNDQGLDRIGNDRCSISVKTEIVPTVEDWDAVYRHILSTEQFELLHKRMSASTYREFLSLDMELPGVKPTDVIRINYRSR
tara:strand:+ start:528 stop:947 length:420 start_codon:yes stop_codon:yes gene_type:complete